MAEMAESQEALLLELKQKGPQTVRQLADCLTMTTMGVRQHLTVLAEKGLVKEGQEKNQSRGRPVKPWQLTKSGHERFPDTHAGVTLELIESVRDLFGEQGLENLIDHRASKALAHYRSQLDGSNSLLEKTKILARIRTQEGYMASVEECDIEGGHGWLLIENHCPICAAAQRCQGFCKSELEIFQTLLSPFAEVKRVEHLLLGARRCAYFIKPLNEI